MAYDTVARTFAASATLGECCHECCILRHDFCYQYQQPALLCYFGL